MLHGPVMCCGGPEMSHFCTVFTWSDFVGAFIDAFFLVGML